MREFTVREIDRSPFLEKIENGFFFPAQNRVDRPASRSCVIKCPGRLALLPPPHTLTINFENPTHTGEFPTSGDGEHDQLQNCGLDGAVDSGWDRAVQPQADFPRNTANSTACSITVDCNRAISACKR